MAPGLAIAATSLDSQLGTAWECPSPAQVAAISNCFITQARFPGQNLGPHDPGNLRASAPSGQLQTMSEHHHPPPEQLILHRGWRLVVSGHSQFLLLAGLGKSLLLTCQQRPRLNYKRSVYSAHMKGIPRIRNLGNRGGCATGPNRTPTILGHTTRTWSHSGSI